MDRMVGAKMGFEWLWCVRVVDIVGRRARFPRRWNTVTDGGRNVWKRGEERGFTISCWSDFYIINNEQSFMQRSFHLLVWFISFHSIHSWRFLSIPSISFSLLSLFTSTPSSPIRSACPFHPCHSLHSSHPPQTRFNCGYDCFAEEPCLSISCFIRD